MPGRVGTKLLRIGIAVAMTCVGCVTLVSAAGTAAASVRHSLHIPRQNLDAALQELAKQTGLQIARFSDAVKGDTLVGPLNGSYSVDQALRELLAPNGLTYRPLNSRAYIVVPAEPASASPRSAGVKSSDAAADFSESLEEIIVTAQKVEERLRDIPMSVTAITSSDLRGLGATEFVDFANAVPSLNFTSSGIGQTQVNLRGITSGYNVSPTVGIYVDDVPYGSSTPFVASAQLALDVGLFDMNRIEVLRGPQGTLYGASTMGGLLKYVTNAPETDAFSGTMRASVASIEDGGVGYSVSSAVNMPLVEDKAALRVGGFFTHNGGYVDNLTLHAEDVDQADVYGGRVDFLFAPNERFSVRLTAFAQNIDRDGSIAADFDRVTHIPVDGKLQQRRVLAEPFEQSFRLVSATVKYEFDFATLTSISSYQTVRSDAITDFSELYVPAFAETDTFGAVSLVRNADTDKVTQEIRLSAAGSVLDWLVGVFYTHEDSEQFQHLVPYDLNGAPSVVDLITLTAPSDFREHAGFGNLTFHVTDKLDLSGGVRYAHNSQGQAQLGSGRLIDLVPERRASDSVATYLANLRYRVNDFVMPYVRFATGYRPGGPNATVNNIDGEQMATPTFAADKLLSYEAGVKLSTADRRFNLDLSVYHIDWNDMQVTAIRNGLGVIANAAKARSQGMELTVTALPISSLTLTGALGYTHAELTKDAPDLGGVKGESLPDTPEITAALMADYRFGVRSHDAFAGTTVRYVAERNASFDHGPGMPQYELPDYSVVDVRAGIVLGSTRVQLYCKNVANTRGQLSAMTGTSVFGGPANVSMLQPRTFGVGVAMSF